MLSYLERDVFTIGIFGSNGKSSTANMLSSIFNNQGLRVNTIFDKKDVTCNRNMTNIETYKKLKKTGNNDIIIIEITNNLLKTDELIGINFDILIHCRISEGSYESSMEGISKINSFISSSQEPKTVIINTDDQNWKNIIIDLENSYLITYGLGNKATVTASSIEFSDHIKFCYCLQRALTSFNNKVIEPMEIPISIKGPAQYNVYNGLAAITCAVLYGIHTANIVSSLEKIILNSGLRTIYSNGFKVIDNVCETILSFETGFESVQNLSYDRIKLVFNLSKSNSVTINNRIIEVIGAWSLILKINNIYFITDDDDSEQNFRYSEKLKSCLHGQDINIIEIKSQLLDIEVVINTLIEKDLLLFFCNDNLNFIKENIIDTLDKRILGDLSEDADVTKIFKNPHN